METEVELIQGINNIAREIQEKKEKLKALSPQPMSGYKRKLTLELELLKGQMRVLEHILVIG